jgi:histidyl-tRNA synthetase
MPRIKKALSSADTKDDTIKRRVKKFSRLRGMKDILSDEYKYWDLVLKKANDLAKIYGFKRVETPILENLGLYEKATGKETDIVNKEMYSFQDRNGDKIALRPEATPGIVRSYIEHGMFNLPQPVKISWVGSCFRHDRPQSGRYRQFNQFDLEIFGEESPVADTLLILIAYNFFKELQIDTQVQINSIGCSVCRKEYTDKLIEFYKERGKRTKLCSDCKKRLLKNPLRLLDCKEDSCVEVREDAPQIVDYLCDDCKNLFIRDDFIKGVYTYAWDKNRWERLRREGWITVFSKRNRTTKKFNTYTTSFNCKQLITRIYRILLGEENLPISDRSVFYKNKTYTDKVFNKAIDDMIKDKER